MSAIKTKTVTVHWYDNKSHEGMAKTAQGNLIWINAISSKYKPTLKGGDKIIVRGLVEENIWNPKKVGKS